MSEEMKMADYFPEVFAVPDNESFEVQHCCWLSFGKEYKSKIEQDDAIEQAVLNHDGLTQENKVLREVLEVLCSRLNEDGVNTTNIGADLLRGQKLLNELGER